MLTEKKRDIDEYIMLNINRMKHFFERIYGCS